VKFSKGLAVCLSLVSAAGAWATLSLQYLEASGPGYPLTQEQLYAQRDQEDTVAMRRHGWDIWAAITRSDHQGFPAFLTWYQVNEVFQDATLQQPRQFRPTFNHPVQKTLGLGDAILSFNTYNQPMFDHIRKHRYQRRDTLKAMVGREPKVKNFPDTAIMVKTVWWPVRRDGLTAFPVWDDQPQRPVEWGRGIADRVKRGDFPQLTAEAQAELTSHELHGNDFETFNRLVAIDPSSPLPVGPSPNLPFFDLKDLSFSLRTPRPTQRVALNDFFHFTLTDPKQVDDLNTLPDLADLTVRNWGRPLQKGDHLALIAAHVSTRETDDWVWATYWWHDKPGGVAGSDRLDSVQGLWRHFRMRVAYHGEIPREPDGAPAIAYNPYLEAGFSEGPRSNCVSCHQRAVLLPSGKMGPVFPLPKGQLQPDDDYFQGKLQLDLVWSLGTRTQ